LKQEIEEVRLQIERARQDYNLEEAARLEYGELPELEKRLKTTQSEEQSSKNQLLKEEVDAEDIAVIVGHWTGIPVQKLIEGEGEKLKEKAKNCCGFRNSCINEWLDRMRRLILFRMQ